MRALCQAWPEDDRNARFGRSHDDQALWCIAAFVSELPAMTPERYAEMGSTEEHRHGSGSYGG